MSKHLLLWMNDILDFITSGFAKLGGKQRKLKILNENKGFQTDKTRNLSLRERAT